MNAETAETSLVFDTTAESFEAEVLQRSLDVPVLVDFWADWCGPCKALAPILERVVASYDGKLLLAKVDTDAQQALAAEHGIRSLPTVRLYKGGEVVTEFMGVQPESQIRARIEQFLPRSSDRPLREGLALLEDGNADQGLKTLADAYESDPTNEALARVLAESAATHGQLEQARQVISRLTPAQSQTDWVRAVKARLLFAEVASAADEPDALRTRLDQDPADSQARYELAAALTMVGNTEAAMEELLTLVKSDRRYGDDAGRKGLLSLFELLGDDNQLVVPFRQRMASALY